MRRLIEFFESLFFRLFGKKHLNDGEDLRYRWKFRDYVWPHDVMNYKVSYKESGIVVNCTGVFAGDDAYEHFKNLASLFYQPNAGILEIPNIGSYVVHFVKFELKNEPIGNYIAYECEFVDLEDCFRTLKSNLNGNYKCLSEKCLNGCNTNLIGFNQTVASGKYIGGQYE